MYEAPSSRRLRPARSALFPLGPAIAALVSGVLMLPGVCSLAVAEDNADEAAAVAKIELLGGRITRDEARPDRPVIGVTFPEDSHVRAKFLGVLKSLPHLTELDLSGTQITDAGLAEIEGLPELTKLRLYDTRITDAALDSLKTLPKLATLNLSRTEVTDRAVRVARAIENLHNLDLSITEVTDAFAGDSRRSRILRRSIFRTPQSVMRLCTH